MASGKPGAVQIDSSATYERDSATIIDRLDDLYSKVMLEEYVPDPVTICRVFVRGAFRYIKRQYVEVDLVADFLKFIKSVEGKKREIVVANVLTRLDAVKRIERTQTLDDEIPF